MRPSEELLEQETAVGGCCGSYSDLKMTYRGPVTQKISSRGKGNHLLGRQWERALAAVPMLTNRFEKKKKAPHDAKFVHDRAETPLPKHHRLDNQPSSTRRPLLSDLSSGWLRWSTGSLRRNHLVWPLTGDLTSMGRPLTLGLAEQGPKPPLEELARSKGHASPPPHHDKVVPIWGDQNEKIDENKPI
ncbi:hypothetical protein E2C01_024026 [Portunus trituberculatus]|uniref:Uncharacterized protein n=1 Tax=Portunus trituberculatus TaxID=210409 RepID=A0A5B7EBI7_PORTR|nr:hypothetical protein [Portunus trituberculatus]